MIFASLTPTIRTSFCENLMQIYTQYSEMRNLFITGYLFCMLE